MSGRFFIVLLGLCFLISCTQGTTAAPTPSPTETAVPLPTLTLQPAPTETAGVQTLRQLAEKKHIQIGTYLNGQWFPDPQWQEIAAREFNLAVITSGFYWEYMEAQRGQFDFSFVEEQVAFAKSNNMSMVGHALLLAQSPYIPDWLAQGNFSKDELSQILRDFIAGVMDHYKGRIGTYLVVEDAPLLPQEMKRDVFYKQFGYDYIDLAFQIARETDPSAMLIYNAGDNETAQSPASKLTHQIVERLQSEGLIDGVGFEMHLDANKAPSKADVMAEMKSYGLPVHVTEIDVDLSHLSGTKQERYTKQAQVYSDMLSACVESGVCRSFSLWGFGDKYSWLRRHSSTADPTPFDDDLNPKPAYFALLDALR